MLTTYKDKEMEDLEDEIEVKYLKSILLFDSKDIRERTVLRNGEVVGKTRLLTFIFGNSIDHLRHRTENLVPSNVREKCISFFNPLFSIRLLHMVFLDDPSWYYFSFYLQTQDKEFISFKTKDDKLWVQLGRNMDCWPQVQSFMEQNIQSMKAKQQILRQYLDDVCDEIPVVLYGIIAEYTIGFV